MLLPECGCMLNHVVCERQPWRCMLRGRTCICTQPALLLCKRMDVHNAVSASAKGILWAQVLYALALVPVGFLADRADRPRLLSGGLAAWSLLTMAASKARRRGSVELGQTQS